MDGLYRVLDVSRTSVTLRHGSTFYHLTLGAGSTAPAGTAPTPALLWPAAPAAPRPKDAAFAPVRHSRRPFPLLAQAGRSLIKMANGYLAHAALTPPDAGHLRVTETSRVALRFLDDPAPAGGMEDARTRLAMGVTLYRNGQRLEARAAWQSVQATDDFDAAEEAKKLLYRYP